MVVSSFAIGLLAQSLFFLGFTDACLVCLFFNLLGIIPVCYFSTFGPRLGLRQMVLSRYWFGWYGVKISALYLSRCPTLLTRYSCCIQCPCLPWLVGSELDRRRTADQRCQQRCPRLCRHHHHRRLHVACHLFRIQDCSSVRILVMDPNYHCLHNCPGCICALRRFCQYPYGRWYQ